MSERLVTTYTLGNIETYREQLSHRRSILLSYLQECTRVEDWHGVQDCASDLREVDAKVQILIQVEASLDIKVEVKEPL